MRKFAVIVTLLASSSAIIGAVGLQPPPQLAMLERLERGSWQLSNRGDGVDGKARVCLVNGRELIQLRHSRQRCRSTIVDDTPNEVTVQYSCPGNGYGRTHIRRESDELVQLDSQGIENGLPFAFSAEARWVGSCSR